MKTILRYSARTVPAVVSALLLAGCGGGSGTPGASVPTGGAGGTQQIATAAEGARAAAASIDTGYGIAPLGVKLADMAASANAEIGTVPVTFIPVTLSCATRLPVIGGGTSTPGTATVLKDPLTGETTATFNTCRSGAREVDGTATLVQSGNVSNFTLGSATAPLTVTEYVDAASSTVTDVFKASGTLSYAQSVPAESLTVNGSVESWNYAAHTHDRYQLGNASISIVTTVAAIGADPYNQYAMTFGGQSTRTAFMSDVDPTVKYNETTGFANFGVAYKTPAAGSAAVDDYLAMNGDFSIATVPAGRCIDGTFTVSTGSDIRIVKATGMPVAGQLTIDASAVATVNADGSISVAMGAGGPATTYAQSELLTLCAL